LKKWPAFSRSFNLLKLRLDETDWQASDEIAWDTPAATVNVPSRNVPVTTHRKPLMMRSIGSLAFKFAQANSQIFELAHSNDFNSPSSHRKEDGKRKKEEEWKGISEIEGKADEGAGKRPSFKIICCNFCNALFLKSRNRTRISQ